MALLKICSRGNAVTCPMAPYIFQNIHESIEFLEGVASVDIQLVWDPPWSKDKISESGKMELGLV